MFIIDFWKLEYMHKYTVEYKVILTHVYKKSTKQK